MKKAITIDTESRIFFAKIFLISNLQLNPLYLQRMRNIQPDNRLKARLSTASIVRSPSSLTANETALSAIALG
jgi:hypothetical protein